MATCLEQVRTKGKRVRHELGKERDGRMGPVPKELWILLGVKAGSAGGSECRSDVIGFML